MDQNEPFDSLLSTLFQFTNRRGNFGTSNVEEDDVEGVLIPFKKISMKFNYATTISTFVGVDEKSYIAVGYIGHIYVLSFPSCEVVRTFNEGFAENNKVRSIVYFKTIDCIFFVEDRGSWGSIYRIRDVFQGHSQPKISNYIKQGMDIRKISNTEFLYVERGDYHKNETFSIVIAESSNVDDVGSIKNPKREKRRFELDTFTNISFGFNASLYLFPNFLEVSTEHQIILSSVHNVREVGFTDLLNGSKVKFVEGKFKTSDHTDDIRIIERDRIIIFLVNSNTLEFFDYEGTKKRKISFTNFSNSSSSSQTLGTFLSVDNICVFLPFSSKCFIFRHGSGKFSMFNNTPPACSKNLKNVGDPDDHEYETDMTEMRTKLSLADSRVSSPRSECATCWVKEGNDEDETKKRYIVVAKAFKICIYEVNEELCLFEDDEYEWMEDERIRIEFLRQYCERNRSYLCTVSIRVSDVNISVSKILLLQQ